MAQLRQDFPEFAKRDAVVVVAGPDSPEDFREYWARESFPFVGLPDPRHRVLKLYGQEVRLFKLGRLPAQVVIDKAGIVRYAHFGHSMADIPPNGEILSLLDEIDAGPERS